MDCSLELQEKIEEETNDTENRVLHDISSSETNQLTRWVNFFPSQPVLRIRNLGYGAFLTPGSEIAFPEFCTIAPRFPGLKQARGSRAEFEPWAAVQQPGALPT
jgi:hypothetical protein